MKTLMAALAATTILAGTAHAAVVTQSFDFGQLGNIGAGSLPCNANCVIPGTFEHMFTEGGITVGAWGGGKSSLPDMSRQAISKVVTAGILYFGAKLVIDGQLTVGELVAFNLLAGRVSAPVLRLAQIWQDFHQARLSVARLGDILNTPAEPLRGQHPYGASGRAGNRRHADGDSGRALSRPRLRD